MLLAFIFALIDPGIPPVPLAQFSAAEMTEFRGMTWSKAPLRQTMLLNTGPLTWCNDPDCPKCAPFVYGRVGAWRR